MINVNIINVMIEKKDYRRKKILKSRLKLPEELDYLRQIIAHRQPKISGQLKQ